MSDHDFERCFLDGASRPRFSATDPSNARSFGRTVKALALSNREYQPRYNRLGQANKMKRPPGSSTHIMPGYLVVRMLGTERQYETWMPGEVFEELYKRESD